MSALIFFLILALLALCAGLLWLLARLQRRLTELQARLDASPQLPLPLGNGGSKTHIAIRILNPIELATRETRLAPAAARLAPRMIERIVYERAATQIAQQMAEQGVVAEVKAHVA